MCIFSSSFVNEGNTLSLFLVLSSWFGIQILTLYYNDLCGKKNVIPLPSSLSSSLPSFCFLSCTVEWQYHLYSYKCSCLRLMLQEVQYFGYLIQNILNPVFQCKDQPGLQSHPGSAVWVLQHHPRQGLLWWRLSFLSIAELPQFMPVCTRLTVNPKEFQDFCGWGHLGIPLLILVSGVQLG